MNQFDVRVILLGRTGLDGALRTDPGVELIRAKSPLEVIGELTQPGEPASTHPVVVVGPQVDGLREHTSADESRVKEFVAALRVAAPDVVVLAVQNGTAAPAGFDGSVNADSNVEQVRQAVRWRPGGIPAAAVQPSKPTPPRIPAPTLPVLDAALVDSLLAGVMNEVRQDGKAPEPTPQSRGEKSAREGSLGDAALVAMVLRGQDPLQAGVAAIRERLGDPGVEFVPSGGDGREQGLVSVAWEGTTYGWLRGTRGPAGVLAPHARWLAGWLRLRDQQNQLRTAAFTDALTGAWNRRYFDRFLSGVLDQARSARRNVTVLLFDIDDFKKYNDLYGHDAGDEILRETVRLLRSVIRPTDRVCRVGGDEFAVIFNEPDGPRVEGSRHPSSVFDIAHRFQQQVLRHQFPKLLACAPGTLTISGGLATFPWDGDTPDTLLAKADQYAMASKRQGKNAITIGPGAMRLLAPEH